MGNFFAAEQKNQLPKQQQQVEQVTQLQKDSIQREYAKLAELHVELESLSPLDPRRNKLWQQIELQQDVIAKSEHGIITAQQQQATAAAVAKLTGRTTTSNVYACEKELDCNNRFAGRDYRRVNPNAILRNVTSFKTGNGNQCLTTADIMARDSDGSFATNYDASIAFNYNCEGGYGWGVQSVDVNGKRKSVGTGRSSDSFVSEFHGKSQHGVEDWLGGKAY
jgi:hypothetical protein